MGKIKNTDISIVYRALNEEKWFVPSLNAMKAQILDNLSMEIVLVDSGSTDRTLQIADNYGCRVTHITKADFSFGRSLNQGCDFARGKYLVFISAHCIPVGEHWLQKLIQPLIDDQVHYTYGRQIGHKVSHFSEKQVFQKYFPAECAIPQQGFFCNNANAAIKKETWQKYRFDEEVTGLEDMVLGKQLSEIGCKLGYVSQAAVTHVHEETFKQTKNRYYREALTLRDILPDVHMGFGDFIRYTSASIKFDYGVARQQRQLSKLFWTIVRFRFAQFWGAYKGHNEIRKISRKQKESYYYPDPSKKNKGQNQNAPPMVSSRACAK